MKQYLDLLQLIINKGNEREDRTGVGTIGIFGHQMRFDLNDGFPLLTTKKLFLKGIIHELLWFLKGDTNVKYLQDNGVNIWNLWATKEACAKFGREEGDLGPIYGHNWINFGGDETAQGVNQIKNVVEQIKTNPYSRRLIVSAWNPKELNDVFLVACHTMFQFYVQNNKLSCHLYQRSADLFIGLGYNIASYALLTMMIAQVTNLELGEFIHTIGDAHIYKNHIEQVKLQLTRGPKELPTMKINPNVKDIFSFKFEDFKLENYEAWPHIKGDVAV